MMTKKKQAEYTALIMQINIFSTLLLQSLVRDFTGVPHVKNKFIMMHRRSSANDREIISMMDADHAQKIRQLINDENCEQLAAILFQVLRLPVREWENVEAALEDVLSKMPATH